MSREVEVTFTATERDPGEYLVHGDGRFTIWLDPDRDCVDVVEIPREYKFGQIYKVSSNTTFDPSGYGYWMVIRDRETVLHESLKFACPQSGNVYTQRTWDAFIDGREVELVSEEYVRDNA